MSEQGKRPPKGREGSAHNSHASHSSHSPSHPLLPPRGDYRTLLSFQKAEVVYDITFRFAHTYLSRGDRTIDQMIQSARSGKKNILEGSKAGLTSKEMEIKLTHQTNYLIDQQLRRLERDFLQQGGLRERMTRARLEARTRSKKQP